MNARRASSFMPVPDARRSGWHPQSVDCPECGGTDDPDPGCQFCEGRGAIGSEWIVYDGLYVQGGLVATIECFEDDARGPWYANAITPGGDHQRRVMSDHAAAAFWCEDAAGLHPVRVPTFR